MAPPLGWKTARPEPISSGKLNRSSSLPRRRWSRFSASSRKARCALSAAPPVRRGRAHELERRDHAGGRHVRAAAQIAPGALAGLAVEVVVDGELGAADLHHVAQVVGGRAALEADELELVGLARELGAGLVLGHDAAVEALAALDDVLHALLERREVFGGERALDVEVVVEAVADRRADAELGLGEQLLHGLREHVRGRVPQHRAAVLGVDGDGLEDLAAGHDVGQVLELAVDAGDDDRAVGVDLSGGGALRHLADLVVAGQVANGDLGHADSKRWGRP